MQESSKNKYIYLEGNQVEILETEKIISNFKVQRAYLMAD
jgi:hypothetical protein